MMDKISNALRHLHFGSSENKTKGKLWETRWYKGTHLGWQVPARTMWTTSVCDTRDPWAILSFWWRGDNSRSGDSQEHAALWHKSVQLRKYTPLKSSITFANIELTFWSFGTDFRNYDTIVKQHSWKHVLCKYFTHWWKQVNRKCKGQGRRASVIKLHKYNW